MARKIIDTKARDNIYSTGIGMDYLSLPQFGGNVDTSKKTVQLKKSQFGLTTVDPLGQFKIKYNSIQIDTEECTLSMEIDGDVRTANVGSKELRFLKALVLEQVNECMAYSSCVSKIFWAYVLKVMSFGVVDETTPGEGDEPMLALLKQLFLDFRETEGI